MGGERHRHAAAGRGPRATAHARPVRRDADEETYHATLEVELDGRILEVDARPSDSLALAVRTGVRIFASEAVLDMAGVEPETPVDQKLEVFREFINSLDVDLEEGHRENPGLQE